MIFGNFQMNTAVSDRADKRVEPTSRKEEGRRQVTRIPTRDERRNEAREVDYGDFPLRKAACTVRRSAGSRPNALSLLSGPRRSFSVSARPPLHQTG